MHGGVHARHSLQDDTRTPLCFRGFGFWLKLLLSALAVVVVAAQNDIQNSGTKYAAVQAFKAYLADLADCLAAKVGGAMHDMCLCGFGGWGGGEGEVAQGGGPGGGSSAGAGDSCPLAVGLVVQCVCRGTGLVLISRCKLALCMPAVS
jgi:hypothetical protein